MTFTKDLQPSLLSSEATFPVLHKQIAYKGHLGYIEIPDRWGIINDKTGECVSIVSKEYQVVPHQTCIEIVEGALTSLGLDYQAAVKTYRNGAKFRAIYVIDNPVEIVPGDKLSPVVQVEGSYDANSRERLLLGAYRFTCLNLTVSGGTNFGGFSAIHRGDINDAISQTAPQIMELIDQFPEKAKVFSRWAGTNFSRHDRNEMYEQMEEVPGMKKHANQIFKAWMGASKKTVWDGYNDATYYSTHECRTVITSWKVAESINKQFFNRFSN